MTEEDLRVLTWRVGRELGSWCCPTHHAASLLSVSEGDRNDADVFRRGVRCCATMRMMDLPMLDWLREAIDVPIRPMHDLRNWE
jgi:hypothetical protein